MRDREPCASNVVVNAFSESLQRVGRDQTSEASVLLVVVVAVAYLLRGFLFTLSKLLFSHPSLPSFFLLISSFLFYFSPFFYFLRSYPFFFFLVTAAVVVVFWILLFSIPPPSPLLHPPLPNPNPNPPPPSSPLLSLSLAVRAMEFFFPLCSTH